MHSPSTTEHSVINRFSLAAIRVLAVVAAGIAAYLTWVTLTHGTVAACGDQSLDLACDDVLRSPWSRVVGIPVSLLGLFVYAGIFVTSGWLVPRHGLAEWKQLCCPTLIVIAFGSAIWFLFLQLFVIGHICPFCMTIHLCGMMIPAIVLVAIAFEATRQRGRANLAAIQQLTLGTASVPEMSALERWRAPGNLSCMLAALCALFLMIVLQVFFPAKTYQLVEPNELLADVLIGGQIHSTESAADPPTEATDATNDDFSLPEATIAPLPAEDSFQQSDGKNATPRIRVARHLTFLKGQLKLNVEDHGLLGSSEADQIVIELVDYTCPDCRKLHQQLKAAREHFGEQFAIIVFPVPLETSCNRYIRSTHEKHIGACKYANLTLSVFAVAPDKFELFHDWLMDSAEPPSFELALQHAREIVGAEHDLDQTGSNRLKDYVRFFSAANVHSLPAMIVDDKVVVGVPNSADDIIEMIESQL